jgi:cGMP-dependent protein kinase 1
LFYNTVRQMTVRAEEDMTCLILGRETLSKVLGDQIFVVTFRNFMKWSI